LISSPSFPRSYLRLTRSTILGRAEGFYDNGQKKWEGNYKDGKLIGVGIRYNKDGTEDRRETYKDGELVDLTTFKDGKVVKD
jgi:antitoxin component YwqK of YwqJK toxin-antitoxin module